MGKKATSAPKATSAAKAPKTKKAKVHKPSYTLVPEGILNNANVNALIQRIRNHAHALRAVRNENIKTLEYFNNAYKNKTGLLAHSILMNETTPKINRKNLNIMTRKLLDNITRSYVLNNT